MPAELVERVEVERASGEIPKSDSVQRPGFAATEATEPDKSLLKRIFEGHEEFLGCTPD